MSDLTRELLLDCLSHLWTLSRKSEDYWQQVASLEWEESLSFFSSLNRHPTQIGTLFGKIKQEESEKILGTFAILISRPRSQMPSFFETALWAAVIEAKSQTVRREIFRVAIELDLLSRRLVGAPSELSHGQLLQFMELSKKFVTLSKHMHPAFSHSDLPPTSPAAKKEAAS